MPILQAVVVLPANVHPAKDRREPTRSGGRMTTPDDKLPDVWVRFNSFNACPMEAHAHPLGEGGHHYVPASRLASLEARVRELDAALAAERELRERAEKDAERYRKNGAKIIGTLCDRCLLKLDAIDSALQSNDPHSA